MALGVSGACANRSDTTAQAGAATTAGAQVTARMPPDALDPIMKKVGPTNAEMRKKLMGNMLDEARADALVLAELFGEVERFWAQNNRPDAVKLAQQARTGASGAAGAAAAGDAMKAQAAADTMLAACKECHGMYREGDPQTGFRIRPGVATE